MFQLTFTKSALLIIKVISKIVDDILKFFIIIFLRKRLDITL